MTNQESMPGDKLTMANTFNGAFMLAHAHALTCTVFLRTDFGKEGIGIAGLLSIFLILGWGSVSNSLPMLGFFALWLVAVICQRIKQLINWQRGAVIHSYYNGYPRLSKRLFPRMSELNAKGADAFICLIVGGLLTQFDKPLGWFIMAGFVSIMFTEGMMVEATRRQLQQMRDAEIEQRTLAELYKRGKF